MKIFKVLVFVLTCLCTSMWASRTWYGKDATSLALFKDPVVDLFTDLPIQQQPSLSVEGNHEPRCKRAHQGLFNEVVTVIKRQGQFVKIAFDNLIYDIDEKTQEPGNTFWVHKKHLIFFEHLADEHLSAIPGPFLKTYNTLVLRLPWERYSIATRFVRAPEHDTPEAYGVYALTIHPHKTLVMHIPHSHVRIETARSPQEQRAGFVQSLYDIIEYAKKEGEDLVIPYVWGGSSFVQGYQDQAFFAQNHQWERPGKKNPYMGYDCSELIIRQAQIQGIPYFCKTTVMIDRFKKPLSKSDTLEAGDLIKFPGHVMIVGNMARNELVEACGYDSGFGRVHIIPLEQRFERIKTYQQLRQVYEKKLPVKLLGCTGTDRGMITDLKLFKLL